MNLQCQSEHCDAVSSLRELVYVVTLSLLPRSEELRNGVVVIHRD